MYRNRLIVKRDRQISLLLNIHKRLLANTLTICWYSYLSERWGVLAGAL